MEADQVAVRGLPMVTPDLRVTTEFRHRTATAAFLITPRRGRVVGAKLLAVTLVGAGYAIVASPSSSRPRCRWLAANGVPLQVPHRDVLLVVAGTLPAIPLHGLIGVGVGTLIRASSPPSSSHWPGCN
jgi:ABC-2 type transport system permease protein